MTYSYTQMSQYTACPRRYRHRYLDGWQEKDTRAAMLFGRVFEKALAAYFLEEDPGAVLFEQWKAYRNAPLEYGNGASWDGMFRQGVQLLERLVRDDRVRVPNPSHNLQVKAGRLLSNGNEFVAYFDAIGFMDNTRSLIEWKTSGSSYPEEPAGLLSLDPQMIAYSWISGLSEVAMVVFVRKKAPAIQYLRATISEEQRQQYGHMVEETIEEITRGSFPQRAGIRFPQNGCLSCPFIGLCLEDKALANSRLVRQPGARNLEFLDELTC